MLMRLEHRDAHGAEQIAERHLTIDGDAQRHDDD